MPYQIMIYCSVLHGCHPYSAPSILLTHPPAGPSKYGIWGPYLQGPPSTGSGVRICRALQVRVPVACPRMSPGMSCTMSCTFFLEPCRLANASNTEGLAFHSPCLQMWLIALGHHKASMLSGIQAFSTWTARVRVRVRATDATKHHSVREL